MNEPNCNSLAEVLEEFEARTTPFSEHEVGDAIHRLRDKDSPKPPPMEWLAEVMAFDFCEDYDDKATGWGTYFGPSMAGTNKDGSRWESPPLKLVTQDVLDYWAKRAQESKHPLLKSRYAGLVWDLTKAATGKAPPPEMAWIWIDSIIEAVASGSHEDEIDAITQLKHALELTISLSNIGRMERVRDAILAYEDKVAQDDQLGLWGFSFDCLSGQKKVPLIDTQRTKIIADLEGRLDRVSNMSVDHSANPWAAEAAAIRLAKHYRAQGQPADVRRVLLKYEAAFEKMAEPAAVMLAQSWLENIFQVYRDFGLKEDAGRLLRRIQELGPKAHNNLMHISAGVTITKDEIEEYVQEITKGDLEAVLGRIAFQYLPHRDQVEEEIRNLASKAPTMFLFQTQLVDHKGRPTASVGSIKDDLEGRVVMEMAKNMQFEAFFLRPVMMTLVKKFAITHETLTEYICRAPLFDEDSKIILARGFKAYLEGDSLVAIHVLMPQIENALRILVEITGGTVLKPNRKGDMDLKIFDELLRDERLIAVFGEDVPLYFRVLFTDRRGINLRNNVFHGIAQVAMFNLGMADRVVHSLFLLAQVKMKEELSPGSSKSEECKK